MSGTKQMNNSAQNTPTVQLAILTWTVHVLENSAAWPVMEKTSQILTAQHNTTQVAPNKQNCMTNVSLNEDYFPHASRECFSFPDAICVSYIPSPGLPPECLTRASMCSASRAHSRFSSLFACSLTLQAATHSTTATAVHSGQYGIQLNHTHNGDVEPSGQQGNNPLCKQTHKGDTSNPRVGFPIFPTKAYRVEYIYSILYIYTGGKRIEDGTISEDTVNISQSRKTESH